MTIISLPNKAQISDAIVDKTAGSLPPPRFAPAAPGGAEVIIKYWFYSSSPQYKVATFEERCKRGRVRIQILDAHGTRHHLHFQAISYCAPAPTNACSTVAWCESGALTIREVQVQGGAEAAAQR